MTTLRVLSLLGLVACGVVLAATAFVVSAFVSGVRYAVRGSGSCPAPRATAADAERSIEPATGSQEEQPETLPPPAPACRADAAEQPSPHVYTFGDFELTPEQFEAIERAWRTADRVVGRYQPSERDTRLAEIVEHTGRGVVIASDTHVAQLPVDRSMH